MFTVEPQGSASILDSERPFREGGRSGGDWLETGVNAVGIGPVILQVNEEIKKWWDMNVLGRARSGKG